MGKKRHPPRIPFTAHGFRAQFLRCMPRGAWWAKRWIAAIEEMRLGARAGRGRSYAESGQALSLSISSGHVEALVLGARPDPYEVRIDFAPLPDVPRRAPPPRAAVAELGEMTTGRILAGDMPVAVDEYFSKRGFSPYPVPGRDRFWCSCPDWSKPCKHIAAVLYLIGDALVKMPSLLLSLRGLPVAPDGDAASGAIPLWKGETRLVDAIDRIRRRADAPQVCGRSRALAAPRRVELLLPG